MQKAIKFNPINKIPGQTEEVSKRQAVSLAVETAKAKLSEENPALSGNETVQVDNVVLAINTSGTIAIAALPLKMVKNLSDEDRVKYYQSEVILASIPQHSTSEIIAQSLGHFWGKIQAKKIQNADRMDPKGIVRDAYQSPVDKALLEAQARKERREALLNQKPMMGYEVVQAMKETGVKND